MLHQVFTNENSSQPLKEECKVMNLPLKAHLKILSNIDGLIVFMENISVELQVLEIKLIY